MLTRNNATAGKIPRFGPFCVRTTTRVLLKDGAPVPLGGRAFDLLATLVAHGGQVLSRRDLLDRAWPRVTVQESNLRVQIANLRKVLGRQENGAHYIVTVAAQGYSFIADVRYCADPDIEVSASPRISEPCKLPPRLSRMIGRERVIADLTSMLASDGFVSVVGAGGLGKTTVAITVAHELLEVFDNSVYFVDLGSLADPDLIGSAIASAVGCSVYDQDAVPALISFLASRRLLLILDNCEHLIEAVADVTGRLVNELSGISILTTSREQLRVDGEHVYRLLPLDIPGETADLAASQLLMSPAVQLFAERASASGYRDHLDDADAKTIAEICRKLDGVPLAIELAASRSGLHGIRQTAKLLDDRFSLLSQGRRDALPRHQTLQAMIDWSYDLLSKQEQEMLRWLSIFSGDFTLSAALFIAAPEDRDDAETAEIVASLVNRSLIWVTSADGETFYRLPETTRAYALAKLRESGDRDGVARRHALYYARNFAPDEAEAAGGGNISTQSIHLGNIRAALNWAFSEKGQRWRQGG